MSMKNKYLICMLAFLGMGLADLFYLNSKIIPAIWPLKQMTAQSPLDPPETSKSEPYAPVAVVEDVASSAVPEHENLSEPEHKKLSQAARENSSEPDSENSSAKDRAGNPTPLQPSVNNNHIKKGVNRNNAGAQNKATVAAVQPGSGKPESARSEMNQLPEKRIETQPLLVKEVVVPFESGKYQLSRKALKKLLAKLEGLSFDASIWVIIDGHSDITGTAKFNNDLLSRQRAESIAEVFKQQGALEDHLKISGHGDSQPLDGRDMPEAFAKNRRAEIKIFKEEP